MWVIGVGYREGHRDPLGENTKSDILGLGLCRVSSVKTLQTYVIEGVKKEEAERIGQGLLTDNIIQYFSLASFSDSGKHLKDLVKNVRRRGVWAVEVFFRPGVMDVVGLSVANAIEVMGMKKAKVRTGTTYVIEGKMSEKDVKAVCEKCLANKLIQTYDYRKL